MKNQRDNRERYREENEALITSFSVPKCYSVDCCRFLPGSASPCADLRRKKKRMTSCNAGSAFISFLPTFVLCRWLSVKKKKESPKDVRRKKNHALRYRKGAGEITRILQTRRYIQYCIDLHSNPVSNSNIMFVLVFLFIILRIPCLTAYTKYLKRGKFLLVSFLTSRLNRTVRKTERETHRRGNKR